MFETTNLFIFQGPWKVKKAIKLATQWMDQFLGSLCTIELVISEILQVTSYQN